MKKKKEKELNRKELDYMISELSEKLNI